MYLKSVMVGAGAALVLGWAAASAQAAQICNGCDYVDGSPATYLGAHDASVPDSSTFEHALTNVDFTGFTDYWVFDITPAAFGSASADFTITTAIAGFNGALYHDGGSACAGPAGTACASRVLGAVIDTANEVNRRWEIVFDLEPGRYILAAAGTTIDNSIYTGQISFVPRRQVPEPGSVLLLGAAAAALGLMRRRRI